MSKELIDLLKEAVENAARQAADDAGIDGVIEFFNGYKEIK